MTFNVKDNLVNRFYDHTCLGLASTVKIDKNASYKHKANLIEKTGNAVLWVVGSIPRNIKWIKDQFKDPRVVTITLTALALFTATFCFYPLTTALATKGALISAKILVSSIPFWSAKLSAYILTCSTIMGYGLRAGGRFANSSLMKAFYGLPETFQGNPSHLTINQLRAAKRTQQEQLSANT